MHQKQGYGGRGNAGYSRRLADRLGLMARELLLNFDREPAHTGVVNAGRQGRVFQLLSTCHLGLLPDNIPLIFSLNLNLLGNRQIVYGRA